MGQASFSQAPAGVGHGALPGASILLLVPTSYCVVLSKSPSVCGLSFLPKNIT